MGTIRKGFGSVVGKLSDQNYAKSLAFCRFWLETGQTYIQVPSDPIFDAIWDNRVAASINPEEGEIFHSSAHLLSRFASDVESDPILAPYSPDLQSRLCARSLQEFATNNLIMATHWCEHSTTVAFYADVNLIAHWVNLGYVEEAAIRNYILQSLLSHPVVYHHQMLALVILFKLAGATFEAYTDSSVVDRCFELLGTHSSSYDTGRRDKRYVELTRRVKGGIQEIVALRERGWEGLPPPPVFTTRGPKPTGAGRADPAATPVATSLGLLPNRDLDPQVPQPSPLEPITTPEPNAVPESPVTPVTHSPSISIATLSDFTIADASESGDEYSIDSSIADAPDNEPPTNPTIAGTSDDELPIGPTVVTPHEMFYLEDGNVEVLCRDTLFRIHVSTLSFHSPALRQMFAPTILAAAESPNGCPRILSSDMATDFATLLKLVYLPGFPERGKVPDFTTFSSLLRITAKYEMPTVRSQILEVIRDAYPETFEGLVPSKPLGESVFSGPTPHPNEVLNLFVQQKLTSALPIAYYMAARRGPNSLIGRHLPRSATLSPEMLESAIGGLMGLREVELNGAHRLIFGPKGSHPCSTPFCPARTPTGPVALEAYQEVFGRIVGPSQLGTKVLEVPEFYRECAGGLFECVSPGICGSCVKEWERGHAELRKKAWATLSDVFGLKGRTRARGLAS